MPALPALKAVLLVGPIDGDYGPWTTREKAAMDLVAAVLETYGVTIHRFYAPDNDWTEIVTAAEGAHFFIYRGHGVYWDAMPNPTVGGLALADRFVSADDIRDELRLAPNAIVMLYGCFTAGSSSIDAGALSREEARRRVIQYSNPFLDIGAAGYYANWQGDAFQQFTSHLFQGMTLGQAYERFPDYSAATVEAYSHPSREDMVVWLDKDYYWESWHYNNAFVGSAEETLYELFAPPEIAVAPLAIDHLAEPDSAPRSFRLDIESKGFESLSWRATVSPGIAWLEVEPQQGSGEEAPTIVVRPPGHALGTYQATLDIVIEADGVFQEVRTVPVTLHNVAQIHTNYLPTIVTTPQ